VDAREWHLRSQPMVTRNILSESLGDPRYGGRVLLVEDNLVNQQVAQKYLQRLGCHVQIVDNGLEAVNAFRTERYDLILMDMQMPIMDGITATREIRALERGHHTPIVALTANVMTGQIERCLEAGMDDFLSKPLDVQRLRDVLDRFGLAAKSDFDANESSSCDSKGDAPDDTNRAIDLSRVEAIAEGDHAFFAELLNTFLSSAEQSLDALRTAASSIDRITLGREAHKLKGACANIGADNLKELAQGLETSADRYSEQRIQLTLASVASEVQRLRTFIAAALSART
jgi:two-component system sensor histidine kinase/response regulator